MILIGQPKIMRLALGRTVAQRPGKSVYVERNPVLKGGSYGWLLWRKRLRELEYSVFSRISIVIFQLFSSAFYQNRGLPLLVRSVVSLFSILICSSYHHAFFSAMIRFLTVITPKVSTLFIPGIPT